MSEARSSNSNISRSRNSCENEYPICFCGIKACRRTAHTEDNEGRRFFSCHNFEISLVDISSERMRKLQDLVPNMDKQTNTADMLELAVEYIKGLQKQVQTLSDNRARCTCSNKQQP